MSAGLGRAGLPVYVNGRFGAQKRSGVQRFAHEITLGLQAIDPGLTVLAPADAAAALPGARVVGRSGGQVWEQFALPRAAWGGVLVNLGNTGPVLARRQVVVLHDAGVFSTPAAYSWKFRLWYKTLHYALTRGGARLVTVSEFSRRELARHLAVAPGRINVISEGADHMGRLAADPAVLPAHGLQTGGYVLAVGNLAAHKNLAALGYLADQLHARGLVLAITGGLDAGLFQGDGGARLPAAARYLGRVSDEALKALYQAAACFIVPSFYEGFGLPAVEAMACGCPVVASDIPALRETCAAAAIYANPLLPVALSDAVLRVLDETALAAQLRAAGSARVAQLTWAKAAAALYEIIMEAG